ncbi:unnamed protein product [Sphagnum troendelagicum]|uniref:Ribosomal protein S14 n=1 Tax=Sphagnum troendelagicum TaxID=128251 RepID=A0ABP0ULC8_9BRYO
MARQREDVIARCRVQIAFEQFVGSGRVVGTGSGRRVRARHPASEREDVVARRRMHIRCRATLRRRRRIQCHLLGGRIRAGILEHVTIPAGPNGVAIW